MEELIEILNRKGVQYTVNGNAISIGGDGANPAFVAFGNKYLGGNLPGLTLLQTNIPMNILYCRLCEFCCCRSASKHLRDTGNIS